MNGSDLQVVDSSFTALKGLIEAKDREIESLKVQNSKLWNDVGDLTDQVMNLVKANRKLGEQVLSGEKADVKFHSVEFYQRMKDAERIAMNAKTDLALALNVQKNQRVRIGALENVVTFTVERLEAGDYTGALGATKAATATFRRK